MIDLYTSGAAHQTEAMKAFGHSFGIDQINQLGQINSRHDICAIWGTRHLELMSQAYEAVVVLERGYFKDRTQFYSLGVDGLNGRADFNNDNSPSDRWDLYGADLPPWKSDGDYYLIMGQVAGDMSVRGVDIDQFYRSIAAELKAKTNKPVYFRPHPLSRGVTTGLDVLTGSLEDALAGAAGVITYNSNSGVDAALAGVPVMAYDIGSMVWPIAARTVSGLIYFNYPDRQQWGYNLAYTQWTIDELSNGTAWGHICS